MLLCDTVVCLHAMTSSDQDKTYTEHLSKTSSITLRWRKATDGNVMTCGLSIVKIVLNEVELPVGFRRTMIILECIDNDCIHISNFYGSPFDNEDEPAQESIAKVLRENNRTRTVFGMQQIVKFVKGLGENAAILPIKLLDAWSSRTGVDTRAIRKWVNDDVTKYMLHRFSRLYPKQTDEQLDKEGAASPEYAASAPSPELVEDDDEEEDELASYIAKSKNGFYGLAGFTPTENDALTMAVDSVDVIAKNIAGLQCNFCDRCI